jgi:hypothetical protein
MYHTTIRELYKAKMANLRGKRLNLVAKDDAKFVHLVPLKFVEYGIDAMPFLHVWFALDYYRNHVKDADPFLVQRLEVVFQLSRFRNHRLMKKVNAVLAQHPGKKLFQLPEPIDIEKVLADAKELGIDTSKYMDETTDEDDLGQCTNEWCLNQNATCGKAADNVQVITDLDGTDWLVLIVRQFGPGRAQLAWAGGFVDKGETFTDAALREKDEETGMSLSGDGDVVFDITTTELKPVKMMDWDPRAKLVEGMEVGAVVTHYRFRVVC